MKERKRKITTITIIGIMLFSCVATLSYALWERLFTQSDENRITTLDCFDVTYTEGDKKGTTMQNAIPLTEEEGQQTEAYKVTIKNTCDTTAKYNVILNKKEGSTLNNKNIRTSVDRKTSMLLSEATQIEKKTISGYSVDSSYIIGTGYALPKKEKTINIRSWLDYETKEEGQGKNFYYKITIETTPNNNDNLLFANILKGQSITPEEDMSNGYDYYMETQENARVDIEVSSSSSQYITSTLDNVDKPFNYGAMCYNGREFPENDVCKLITDASDYIDWYTYGNNDYFPNQDATLYRIKKVEGNYITEADILSYTGYDVPNGIVETTDDDGTSYIYRGAVNNNYVKFADKLWRIVRLNGDGTIRIILNDKINELSNIKFNNNANDKKYVGYTYDNGKSCTNESQCDTNTGVSSTIKQTLETWYQNNLQDYDNKIALTKYCNDTSTGYTQGSRTYFGAGERIEKSNTATLKCPNTSETYGGLYNLKIGLISVDEMLMAGLSWLSDSPYSYYLYHSYDWWTMSPSMAYTSSANMFSGYNGYNGYINDETNLSYTSIALPVINLKSDVTVTGTGTQSDPYVVQ